MMLFGEKYAIKTITNKVTGVFYGLSTNKSLKEKRQIFYYVIIIKLDSNYQTASKQDIDKLLLDILPDILDENKKSNKVRNLVYAMSIKDETIINTGTTRNPIWEKV